MNTIHCKARPKKSFKPIVGDIFTDTDCVGAFYILAQTSAGRFAAIAFDNGNRFDDPVANESEAVKDLKYVGRGLKITIDLAALNSGEGV